MRLTRILTMLSLAPMLLAAAPQLATTPPSLDSKVLPSAGAAHTRVGLRPTAVPVLRVQGALVPSVVLQRYTEALVNMSSPRAVIFDYTVEQVGLHDIEQSHRVYRTKGSERDEILEIDGRKLSAPFVRVLAGALDHYDILSVAPRPDHYGFTFVKALRNEGRYDYVFRTENKTPTIFAVNGVTIDGSTFLPSVLTFGTFAGVVHSDGRLVYGPIDGHWLIREASVNASLAEKTARERIVWENYQFPTSLPPSTFEQHGAKNDMAAASVLGGAPKVLMAK